jgi:HAD superfamily hydrolase (TIGR01484 family)
MPTCGTRYYRYINGQWTLLYAEDLTTIEREEARTALLEGARSLGLLADSTWGPPIEDRGSQITYSALGQGAPIAAKAAWDPSGAKKEALRKYVAARLPNLEVRSGGSTSIDVTRKGIDKAYGVRKLIQETSIPAGELLFVGDRLDEGGNDYPVKAMGIFCIPVSSVSETRRVINDLVTDLTAAEPH